MQGRRTFNGDSYVLNLVLFEETKSVDKNPRESSAEVHDFVHHERHNASCEDIVLHKGIPGDPQSLKDIEVNIVFGDLLEMAPVRLRGRRKQGGIPRDI